MTETTPDEVRIMKIIAARKYIDVFRTHTMPGTNYIETSAGRRIELDNLSDEDAVFVAEEFKAMEAAAAERRTHNDN